MTQRPNILFCIADDQSWPHASAYGCPWVNTPAFDRIAREGILFNNAFTPNAKCAPSRAAILTGRYSWQLQEACNHLCFFPSDYATYPETFQRRRIRHGIHRQRLGTGRTGHLSRWLTAQTRRSRTQRPQTQSPHKKHRQYRLRRQFRGFSQCQTRRPALLLLVWRQRTPPRLRIRLWRAPRGKIPL